MERPPSGTSAGLRHFYVAVGGTDAKLATLVELLQALRADARLAVAVACSSRDSVDAVAAALSSCGGFNIAVLHSDLELHEVEHQVQQLKVRLQPAQHSSAEGVPLQQQQQQQPPQQEAQGQPAAASIAAAAAAATVGAVSGGLAQGSWQDPRSLALITSDVCLKVIHRDLLPLGPSLLIQYDIPNSKEVLQRRLTTVFGSSKERGRRARKQVVVDFIVAGELAAFRARERLSSSAVLEMPVHVPDIFA